jgi:hypothetical protein
MSLSSVVCVSGVPVRVKSGHRFDSSSAVGRGRAGWPDHDQQHCYHQAPTVNKRLLL